MALACRASYTEPTAGGAPRLLVNPPPSGATLTDSTPFSHQRSGGDGRHAPPPPSPDTTAAITAEVPGALGAVLASAHRAAGEWLAAPAAERGALFPAREPLWRLDHYGGAADALAAVDAALTNPGGDHRAALLAAASQLAAWGEATNRLRTAGAFAEIAARAAPDRAPLAVRAAQFARRVAAYERALAWYRWGKRLARQSGDWTAYCAALAGLGNLHQQRGNYPQARRHQSRSLRHARIHGLRNRQGAALHNLFVLEMELGNTAEAETYCKAAFEVYGSRHPRLPWFAHDVAWYFTMRGQYAPAIAILQGLLPHFQNTADQVMVWSALARAAGGAGRRDLFKRACSAVWDAVRASAEGAYPENEYAAQALADAAWGAIKLDEVREAYMLASASVEIARLRKEGQVLLTAERMLDSLSKALNAEYDEHAPEPRELETPAGPVAARGGAERVERSASWAWDLVAALR